MWMPILLLRIYEVEENLLLLPILLSLLFFHILVLVIVS